MAIPDTPTGWADNWCKAILCRRTQGWWLMQNSTWAGTGVLTAHRDNWIPSYVKRRVVSSSQEVTLPLHSALVRPHLEYCIQFWCSQRKKDMEPLEQVQTKAKSWLEDWSTSPVKTHWDGCGCSAWRRLLGDPKTTFQDLKGSYREGRGGLHQEL